MPELPQGPQLPKGVVVGYDGTLSADSAVRWAAAEAARRGRPLTVVHAADYALIPGPMGAPPYRPDLAEKSAARIVSAGIEVAKSEFPDVEVAGRTVIAGVTQTLVDLSRDADLLVVGSHGHSEVGAVLLGSVALTATAHAHCPVVVVRDGAALPGPEHPVVVGTDGSDSCTQAVRFAADQAAERGAALTIVAVSPTIGSPVWTEAVGLSLEAGGRVEFQKIMTAEAHETVSAAAQLVRTTHPALPITERIIEGRAADGLVEAARGAGLLVVGSRGRGAFTGLLLGSVGHGCLLRATCPVAIVR
ncbi:universal stress protein [Spongisporangium articulatum]|uniref:Universal stress protein n=1 Tax=Spongisporangium articulatum TaxID=3362603 RepID=A0ABW8AN26_9ACTN